MNKSWLRIFLMLVICWHTSATATVDASIFAADWQYHEAKISPSGKYLGIVIIDKGKRRLAVVNTSDFQPVGGADFGEKQEVGQFFWVNDERLVIKVLEHEPWEESPRYYGELFAINYDGSNGKLIYGYRSGEQQSGSNIRKKESVFGWANIISLIPDDEEHILISSSPMQSNGLITTVHKLNIYNGRMSGILATSPSPHTHFFANRKGKVVAAVGLNKHNEKRAFLYDDEQNWKELPFEDFGGDFTPIALDSEGTSLYVLDNHNQDLTGLFKLDLLTNERTHIYTDEKVDVTYVQYNASKDGVYALLIDDGYPAYITFDTKTEEARVYKELLNTFQGYRLDITSYDSKGRFWLLHASNDVNVGNFFLYDRKSGQFKFLFSRTKGVDPKSLSQSIPINFPAQDGTTVYGYVTYPASVPETQSVPLVVLVHGGPHGERDYWEYNREVQLLTSQGYAVLRVNYRGSDGYGREFENAGYGEWGNLIQQDIIDGTRWVIAQGGIKEDSVCIMGASFGGYSAVQASILAPDLYKCAIANAGVYDLPRLFEEGDIPKMIFGKAFLESAIGMDDTELKQFSPVYNVEKLKTPLLIAHGEKDMRAPISHAEALRERLEQLNKPFDWFTRSTEGHGFYSQENRTDYYDRVVDFLAIYLK